MQDNESTCRHCGQRIREYRGAWFAEGDNTWCTALTASKSHEPIDPDDLTWMRQARAAGWRPPDNKSEATVMNTTHHFILESGDASDDGHGKTRAALVRSSLTMSETIEAYRRGCAVLGHDVIATCCVEYEDMRIPDAIVVALIRSGWDLEANADAYECKEYWETRSLPAYSSWFSIYLHVVRLGEPTASMALIPDASITIGGYGLES